MTDTAQTGTPVKTQIVSRKLLASLSALVLLAHLAVLRDGELNLSGQSPAFAPVFNTRALQSLSAMPAAAAVKPAPIRPRRKPAAPAKREPVAPVTVPDSISETPPAPPAVDVPAPVILAEQPAPVAEPQPEAQAARLARETSTPTHPYRVPGSTRLKYEVKGNKFPYNLSAELLWQQDGENYEARLAFSAAFLTVLSQTSRGQITAQGLAPLRFSDKKRSEVAAHFVREQGKISFSANTPEAPLLAGAQDRLSILLQLGAMIAGDPGAYPQATTLTLQIVGPRDADIWLFTVEAEEALALPGGEQVALKLVRNPREAFDQKVELWLAPALGYLPVRVRITDANGDFVDQKWLSSETAP